MSEKIKRYTTGGVLNCEISCICGHCNNKVAMEVLSEYYIENIGSPFNHYVYYTGQCPHCGKPIIYDADNEISIPYSKSFVEIKYLPDDINKLYNECRDAFSISAYTCCVITARTLMANIAIEQGAEEGKSFLDYVNYLQKNCLPAKTNNGWVDKIRQLGNDSTHHLVIASKEEANLVINFIIAILKNVYEFPNSIL